MVESVGMGVVVGAAVAPRLVEVAPLALAWIGLVGLLALALGRVRVSAVWGLAGFALGWLAVAGQPWGPALEGPVTVQGVVVGAGLGWSADVACTRWARIGEPWQPCAGRVRVRFRDGSPGPGVGVVVRGEAEPVGRPTLPGAPDPVWSARRRRVRSVVRARAVRQLGAGIDRSCSARDPTGVLCAVATGNRQGLDEQLVAVLRRTGTAHVLAISGFHVGVVALIAGSVVWGVLRLRALWSPTGIGRWPVWLAGAGAAVAYAWLAGAPTSAQRAALLVCLGAGVKLRGAESRPLRLLALVAVGVVLVDPGSVGSPAFQLSFGAILGILQVGPRLTRWIPPDLPRLVDWALQGSAVSIAATVGTLPAAAWWFQAVAPWSPLANLVALPWCAVGVVPPAAVAAFAPEPLASWASTIGTLSVRGMVAVLRPLGVSPWTPAVGPVGALLLGAWLAWPKRLGLGVLASWLALGLGSAPAGDRVTFLDVGQGDAALAEVDGRTWLIDGGLPGDQVLAWLRRRGTRRIDVVVASHEEADHVGGLVPVLQSLEVGELWVGMEGPTAARARELGIPVVYRHPSLLHPPLDFVAEDANDGSQVLALAGVLFTGDIEREGERMTWAALRAPVPVLKVPHHGSRTSSSELLLDAVQPTVAVIGVGRDNRYGHPNRQVLERYRERGIAVYRTDRDGTIEVSVREGVVHVRTWRAGRGWGPTSRHPIDDPNSQNFTFAKSRKKFRPAVDPRDARASSK